jgi:hypothetical protein
VKTFVILLGLLAVSGISEPVDHEMVFRGPNGFAVIMSDRIYLTDTTGRVFATVTQAAAGIPRGIVSVIDPTTGNYMAIDPDAGIISNGTTIVGILQH